MRTANKQTLISRRQVLTLGAIGAGSFALLGTARSAETKPSDAIVKEIQEILGIEGEVSNGVLSLSVVRKDLSGVTLHGTPIKPDFMLSGDLVFQSMGGSDVMMNGDMCLKTQEVNRFIRALIKNGIVFQAEHQHMYDFSPIVWFTHFRARGNARTVARSMKAALDETATPFPQRKPANPKTPLPAKDLGKILGADPTIGDDGVVRFNVARADRMTLGGVEISPYLNVDSPVAFQPLGSGKRAAAFADYGMTASEVQRVVGHMQDLGWDSGCLYNQEIDEQPQLYFDHFFKTGDTLQLAHEIRSGFERMHMKLG